jgi:GNAT superfamily N-acetyltransferase
VSSLRIEPVESDQSVLDWQHVHNVIVPPAEMSLAEVRERLGRFILEVVYQGDTLVGCTTVRPPVDASTTATVIVRVLAEHRRQGFGSELWHRALGKARELGAEQIETIVWEANGDGLRFAEARGFAEVSRYPHADGELPFLTLKLAT